MLESTCASCAVWLKHAKNLRCDVFLCPKATTRTTTTTDHKAHYLRYLNWRTNCCQIPPDGSRLAMRIRWDDPMPLPTMVHFRIFCARDRTIEIYIEIKESNPITVLPYASINKAHTHLRVTYRSSRSVTATKTGCHRSASSELSELERPFCKVVPKKYAWITISFNNSTRCWSALKGFIRFTCSLNVRRHNQPMYFSSPRMLANARFASNSAFIVLRAIAECRALNQASASAASVARRMQECMPSGECSSSDRLSV